MGGGGVEGRGRGESDMREGFLLTGELENKNLSTLCQCYLRRYLLKITHSIVPFNNSKRTKCDKELVKRYMDSCLILKRSRTPFSGSQVTKSCFAN